MRGPGDEQKSNLCEFPKVIAKIVGPVHTSAFSFEGETQMLVS